MEKRIKSFIIDIICTVIVLGVFWLIKGSSIYNQITTLKNENNNLRKQVVELQRKSSIDTTINGQDTKSTANLSQSKVNISNTNNSDNPAKKEYDNLQVVSVSVRDLLSDPDKYIGKEIKLGPLKVMSNTLDRNSFDTNVSTGSGFTDYDRDADIEVFYSKTSNFEACKNLSSDNRPIIYVSGVYTLYVNSNKGYIQSNNVWITK